jgi:DNA-binding NarL/FixJ family response regulator
MKKTALVADDHEVFRVFLGSILKDRLGFDRVEAVDSFDAVVAALERSPRVSLVLLDLSMPGMDGASSLATIRTLRPEAHVAVVSGSLDRGDMMAAMASGVHGYVPKALGIQEMTEALGRIAEGQVYLPPSFAAVPVAGAAAPAPAPASAAPAERRAARAVRPGRPPRSARAASGAVAALPPRQKANLGLLREGQTNREIADKLDMAEGTVKSHLAALFKNLGVRNRSEAAVAAARVSPS